jgi:hypothetical protein
MLLGAFLASLKPVVASALQKPRPKSHSGGTEVEIVTGRDKCCGANQLHIPLALMQCVLYAWMAVEFARVPSAFPSMSSILVGKDEGAGTRIDGRFLVCLLMNCLIAFGPNLASFETDRVARALGITIAGNVKQVLVVALGCIVGGEEWSWGKALRLLGTVGGSCWFGFAEQRRRQSGSGDRWEDEKSGEREEDG